MSKALLLLSLFSVLLAAQFGPARAKCAREPLGSPVQAAAAPLDASTGPVPLSVVPAAVTRAAEAAVGGIALEAAARERASGIVYRLAGTANGRDYEITVTADGTLLELASEVDDDAGGD